MKIQNILAALIYPIALVADDRSGHRWSNCRDGAEDLLRVVAEVVEAWTR